MFAALLAEHHTALALETATPVTSVTVDAADAAAPFRVHTPRGVIRARHVIHATNGYSAALVPGLRAKLFPVRGQMTAQRPGPAFPHHDGRRSWSVLRGRGLEYMTQVPRRDGGGGGGDLLLGGALAQSAQNGLDEVGVADDSTVNYEVGAHLAGALPLLFGPAAWGGDDAAAGTGVSHVDDMWTGIMGFTADSLPFVGRLDASITGRPVPRAAAAAAGNRGPAPAEWIAAGYNGEGMVNAWLCGVAVALMATGRDGDADFRPASGDGRPPGRVQDWLPRDYLVSPRRLAWASVYELAARM